MSICCFLSSSQEADLLAHQEQPKGAFITMILLFSKTDNAQVSGGSFATETPVRPAEPDLPGPTQPPYGDSATAVILAISVLISAIAGLLKVLVPVMTQRSTTKTK